MHALGFNITSWQVNIDNGLLAIAVDKSVLDAEEGNQQEKDQERMLRCVALRMHCCISNKLLLHASRHKCN